MKCDFKGCPYKTDSKPINTYGTKKYHDLCALKQIASWYLKYYNETQSWAIMIKLLKIWTKTYSIEYMLYAISKAIQSDVKLAYFEMIRGYVLDNLNFKKMYKAYKNPEEKFSFERVILDKSEYQSLLSYMDNNLKKLEYYIRTLNNYMIKNNKTYDSHYETIKLWYDKQEDNKPIAYTQKLL